MRDIDWLEYERRKKVLRKTVGSFELYGTGIAKIIHDLNADADKAEIHEAKTTDTLCVCCAGKLEPFTGYFDPHMIDVEPSDPRKYEEGWRCIRCGAAIDVSDALAA